MESPPTGENLERRINSTLPANAREVALRSVAPIRILMVRGKDWVGIGVRVKVRVRKRRSKDGVGIGVGTVGVEVGGEAR